MRCTICRHEQCEEIERGVILGTPFRPLAGQYAVSVGALQRHKKEHLGTALEAVAEQTPLIRGERVAAELDKLYERTIHCLDRAEDSGDVRIYLQAIRETRSTIELMAKLSGELPRQLDARNEMPVFILSEGTRLSLDIETGPKAIDVAPD